MQPLVDAWDRAHEDLVDTTVPHRDDYFESYLRWYQVRTRCRITFADTHPEPHQATSQDGYARHRDEALAGAVSDFVW